MKPMLFNTPMVQAILEGRKTQTRRLVTPQPKPTSTFEGFCIGGNVESLIGKFYWKLERKSDLNEVDVAIKPPYQVGDILYVRETCRCAGIGRVGDLNSVFIEYKTGAAKLISFDIQRTQFLSKATWQPSIFMPKEAARIFLKIKSIRIERLWDISEADAKAEGVEAIDPFSLKQLPTSLIEHGGFWGKGFIRNKSYRTAYYQLWNSLGAKRDYIWKMKYCWDANPWVWVYDFERTENNNF